MSNDPGRAVNYGMSMWFEVVVEGIGPGAGNKELGKWSACNGLAVKMKTESIPTGSGYDLPRIAPVAVEYPEVTLERAVRREDTQALKKWLQGYVKHWMLSDEPDATTPGESTLTGTVVRISLFSALTKAKTKNDHLVAEWTLYNAYPVAWTGPSLSAKANDLAMEKLTIAHGGFLHENAPGNPRTAKVKLADLHGKALTLQYQPSDISMDKSVVDTGRLNNAVNQGDLSTDPNKLNVTITVRIEGKKEVENTRERLFGWLQPVQVLRTGKEFAAARASAAKGSTVSVKKEEQEGLRLTLGEHMTDMLVTLRSVSASFKRFGPDGSPIRATFTLKLESKEARKDKDPHSSQRRGLDDLAKQSASRSSAPQKPSPPPKPSAPPRPR